MAKKIRFPLKLTEGAEARTLDELREHFDLQAILEYYKNGKLLTWLEDRYLEGEAEAIHALDETTPDFQQQLCAIFQVEYTGSAVDLDEIECRQERLKKLRSVTDEAEFIQNIDRVAFDQEELADLLDEGAERIYLCGEHFTIPASQKGITYVGIKNPTVHISGKVPEDTAELGIEFVGIVCDNLTLRFPKDIAIVDVEQMQPYKCKNNDLPEKLLHLFEIYEIDAFLITTHYYLYRRKSGDHFCWLRYEISTDLEIEVPDNISDAFERRIKSAIASDCLENLFTISEDWIAYCPFPGHLCALNLESLTIQDYQGIYFYGHQYGFSGSYFAVLCSRKTIKVYKHEKSLYQVHKITITDGGELLMDGNSISNRKFGIIDEGTHEGDTVSRIKIFENSLCFTLSEKSGYDTWLACIDMDSWKCTMVSFKKCVHVIPVAKRNRIVYMIGSDYDSSWGESSYEILAVNLSDGSIRKILFGHDGHKVPVLRLNRQHLVCIDHKKDNDFCLHVVDLDVGKSKSLPHTIESKGIDAICKNRCLLVGSTFYCFRYQERIIRLLGFESAEHGLACRFDLSVDSPELIELDS